MKHIETSEQIAFTLWLSLAYPKQFQLYNSSPLGVNLTPRQSTLLKAKGCKKGWPDIQIMWPSIGYHGFFIELKPPKPQKSQVTPEQKQKGGELIEAGYFWSVAYGWEHAKRLWEYYLKG